MDGIGSYAFPRMSDDACALMLKALERIIGNREEWDQSTWGVKFRQSELASETACRTQFCLAGHTAVAAGAHLIWDQIPYYNGKVALRSVVPVGADISQRRSVEVFAIESLDLTMTQANTLFSAGNSLWRLADLCYLYSDGRVDVFHLLGEPTLQDKINERRHADSCLTDAESTHAAYTVSPRSTGH